MRVRRQDPWLSSSWVAAAAFAVAAWLGGVFPHWAWLPQAPPGWAAVAWPIAAVGVAAAAWAVGARWRRRRRAARFQDLQSLHRLDWAGFERAVGEAFRLQGWAVAETGQGGADGGVDLLLTRRGHRRLVQVKHWQARVSAPTVREMFGLMVHHRARSAAVVALGGFTREAIAFAQGKPLFLIDGPGLLAMLGGRLPERANAEAPVATGTALRRAPRPPREVRLPDCPLCQAAMVRRARGRDGEPFLGCTRYPACTGTRPVPRR